MKNASDRELGNRRIEEKKGIVVFVEIIIKKVL